MEIIINGQRREVPDGQTVMELLHSLQLDPTRVALELDGRILKQPEWPGAVLQPAARLEIVHFVGGG